MGRRNGGRAGLAAVGLAAVGVALGWASVARAGNDDGVLLGNEAAMTGGANAAVATEGGAAWTNPAAIAGAERDTVDGSGSATVLRIAETPRLLSSAATGRAGDGGYYELNGVPSSVSSVHRLAPRLRLGLGLWVPMSTGHTDRVSLDDPTDDYTARWQLVQQESAQRTYAGATLAGEVAERLRLGVTVFGLYQQSTVATDFAGGRVHADGSVDRALALSDLASVQSVGVTLAVGVQWEPTPGLHLGLSLRAPALELGSLERAVGSTISGGDEGLRFAPSSEEALSPRANVVAPARLRGSIGWTFDRGFVALDADVQHALSQPALRLDRRWVGNVRLGARYWIDPQISIGAGVFTDLSPWPRPTRFGAVTADFFGGAVGVEIRTPHRLGAGERADSLVFSQTFALRYAIGTGQVGGLRFDPTLAGAEAAVSVVPTDTTVHEASLHVGSALLF